MPVFDFASTVPASPAEVFAWHERPGAFTRLAPPWQKVRVISWEGGISDGARLIMKIGAPPFAITWEARHKDYREGEGFTDEMVRGPFSGWQHAHRFLPAPDGGCRVADRVEFEAPIPLMHPSIVKLLQRMFVHRHLRIARDLARFEPYRDRLPARVVLAGASGLIGTELAAFLDAGGFEVKTLVRRKPRPGAGEIEWDPDRGALDAETLAGTRAVIILSGAGITERRWSAARKKEIVESRVKTTRLVAETLARMKNPPPVLIAASAIGYYGDCGEDEVSETSKAGEGFLARVCSEWEDETSPAADAGVRVVSLRIGVALSAKGGALKQALPSFKLGLGGYPSPGGNFVSWVSIEDVLGAILHIIFNDSLSGPVNLTAPAPVTSRGLSLAIGKVLHRPVLLRFPPALIRLVAGEMGEAVLLEGARVKPERLIKAGFEFIHVNVEDAIRDELGLWGREGEST